MNTRESLHRLSACLMAVVLVVAGTLNSMAQALQPGIDTRPLTPQDIKDYALTGAQKASGLATVPIGQPVYLEAQVSSSFLIENITSVTWELTSKPVGSTAVLKESPLGANVPVYKPADRLTRQVAGRKVLVADVTGQYAVTATITTTTSSTNVSQQITAGSHMGINTCALCHSGGVVAPDKMTAWSKTGHATFLTRQIDGGEDPATSHYSKNCISCHTVGYDANTNAVNGGFDDVATAMGWTFPSTLTNGNWAAMPEELKNLSNIQCENCHGPGSEHAFSLGNANRISVSWSPGNCAQCHDSKNNHSRNAEWANSGHAVVSRSPSGPTREGCVGCHTAMGFADRVNGVSPPRTDYEAIGCVACHNPHDATNPHQLRTVAEVKLKDNVTTITNGGNSQLCMNCHMGRRNAVNYVETTEGSSHFGPHYSCQTDMIMGVNAITYGKEIPSSAHRSIEGSCLTCHKQSVASSNPAFTHAGGHTFSLEWDGGTPDNEADDVHLTGACAQCHGEIESFNIPRGDFDGDGMLEGAQTEVEGLLHELGMLLPPIGQPEVEITSAYTKQQLKAAFNYKFVEEDGSHGVHNLPFAVGLLKASIADLTDDVDHDGLSDQWEIANFGSITMAASNGDDDGDGVKNGLEMSAGTDPKLADSDGDGIGDLAELQAGSDPTNAADKPGLVVKIFGAAEIEFASEVGKKYQVQTVSELAGEWLNVGSVTNGTGNNISMVTSTRSGGAQGYFRVVQVP